MITKNDSLKADYQQLDGGILKFEYWDTDGFDDLDIEMVRQVYGVCFFNDEMVIVLNGKVNTWGLVGGSREEGESIDQVFRREVEEESNLEVIKWEPIGVQQVTDPDGKVYYQLRVSAKVNQLGDFILDPAGTISEVKLINPKDYKNYFDWGEIGEHIIQRALELKENL